MELKFSAALVILFCVISVFSTTLANKESGPITNENAQDYTEAFLKTYTQQVENNFRPEYREYFDFYANSPYKINATISNTHGAAIEFIPSNKSLFDFGTIEQRIELAIFPDVDLNITSLDVNATVFIWSGEPSQAMFVINGTGNELKGIIFITNKGHFLDLGIWGSVLLSNVIVDDRYYYVMMIKGSNTPSSWTKDIAKEEAMRLFEEDLFSAFNRSEEVRKYIAYPILEEMISQIVWKHQHTEEIGYDLLQYYKDLAKVRDLAVNTYHLNSTFVDEILNWLEDIYPKQPWWEVAPYSWVLGAVVGILVTIVLEKLYNELKRRMSVFKDTKKVFGIIVFIFIVALGVIVGYHLLNLTFQVSRFLQVSLISLIALSIALLGFFIPVYYYFHLKPKIDVFFGNNKKEIKVQIVKACDTMLCLQNKGKRDIIIHKVCILYPRKQIQFFKHRSYSGPSGFLFFHEEKSMEYVTGLCYFPAVAPSIIPPFGKKPLTKCYPILFEAFETDTHKIKVIVEAEASLFDLGLTSIFSRRRTYRTTSELTIKVTNETN